MRKASQTVPAICGIRRIDAAARSVWRAHWLGCSYATFFHGPEWAEAWERASAGAIRPAARLVEFSDGTSAVLPFSEQRGGRGWIRSHVSSPAGTFGGWISRDPLNHEHWSLLESYLSRHPADLQRRTNPYAPAVVELEGVAGDEVTRGVRLADGFAAVESRFHRSARRATQKARRLGVVVDCARSRDDWRAYYEVYRDSLRRWGAAATTRYGWSFFESLRELRSPDVVLWLSRYEGQVVSGAICLRAPKIVSYWHGATLEKFFPLRPAQILFHDAIEAACREGLDWFDLGTSAGLQGVDDFKRSLGAEALPCPFMVRESVRSRALRGLSRWLRPVPVLDPQESK